MVAVAWGGGSRDRGTNKVLTMMIFVAEEWRDVMIRDRGNVGNVRGETVAAGWLWAALPPPLDLLTQLMTIIIL